MRFTFVIVFFFNDTATTEIYTLSLHDALPISLDVAVVAPGVGARLGHGVVAPAPKEREERCLRGVVFAGPSFARGDRKSTRLNSSHLVISYAVFCLKKKKKDNSDERGQ